MRIRRKPVLKPTTPKQKFSTKVKPKQTPQEERKASFKKFFSPRQKPKFYPKVFFPQANQFVPNLFFQVHRSPQQLNKSCLLFFPL